MSETRRFESTVDVESGAIVFPYESFYPNAEESAVLRTAGALQFAACAQERGVDWRANADTGYSTLYDSSTFFGVWTNDQASRFAFFPPSTQADLIANGVIPDTDVTPPASPEEPDLSDRGTLAEHNATLPDEQRESIIDCANDPRVQEFDVSDYFAGPWNDELYAATNDFSEQPQVASIDDELRSCYTENGLTVDADSTTPNGAAFDVINQEQIDLALIVVECKTSIDYVPRLSAIMADMQAPILAKYESELTAERTRLDESLLSARAVLAAAGDTSSS